MLGAAVFATFICNMKSKSKEARNDILELSLSYDNPEEPAGKGNENRPILKNQQLESSYTERRFSHAETEPDNMSYGHDIAIIPSPRKRFGHTSAVAIVLLELVGICCIGTSIIKAVKYHNGFAWDGGEKEFNIHGVFMIIGLVFCYANAAISSYVFSERSPTAVHYLHGLNLFATSLFTIFGMVATGQKGQISRESGFHTWLGIITLLLFSVQTIVGFIGLFPKCGYFVRKRYLKFQVWIALTVFILTIATCLLGFAERVVTGSSQTNNTHSFMNLQILANIHSLILVLFGLLVTSVLFHPLYRYVQEEEEL